MAQNKSRFLQLNATTLLEYVINENDKSNDVEGSDVYSIYELQPIIYNTKDNSNRNNITKMYGELLIDTPTNNSLQHLVVPMDELNTTWFLGNDNINEKYFLNYCDGYLINDNYMNTKIQYDTIRLHILSGYSFNDIFGILVQVRTKNKNQEYIKLANWLYKKSNKSYIFEKPIILNNKIYDKYIEFKIPSTKDIRSLSNVNENFDELFGENSLNITNHNNIENVEIIYSTIANESVEPVYNDTYTEVIGSSFKLNELINIEIPYDSESDKFNIHLEESNDGNYLNFYCTWEDRPITLSTINAFNTRIKLYTSNGYKYDEDNNLNMYDADLSSEILESQNRWIIYHEIVTSFYNKDGKLLQLPQTYNIQQTFRLVDANNPTTFNYNPIINNNVISDVSFVTFEYTARLINRYDGTQIVRKGGLTSFNVERYMTNNLKLNPNSITSYKVYNKINRIDESIKQSNSPVKVKYVKEYVNSSNIELDNNGEILLNRYGGKCLITLKQKTDNGNYNYLDLMNTSSYVLLFKDVNNVTNEINCTYSDNMNLMMGQLEFNISPTIAQKMYNVPDNDKIVAIKCKNLDGSNSIIKEIKYKFN